MEVIHLGDPLAVIPDACVTALGFFDGVHRGHRTLLRRTVSRARALGATPAVFTFDPADASYKAEALRLATAEERLALFSACGIECVFYVSFNAIRDLSPAAFVSHVLVDTCHTVMAVCGYNFRFGQHAAGSARDLKQLMHARGMRACVLPPCTLPDGQVISSSAIRTCIAEGDMRTAAQMLGRPYSVTSPVLHGKKLGRTIGFPTINQVFPEGVVIPAYGVYDILCDIDGHTYRGLSNIGVRPTVDGAGVNCETYLIHYDGDLYDRVLTVRFCRMLRPERHFASVEELKAAITENLQEMIQTYGNRMD